MHFLMFSLLMFVSPEDPGATVEVVDDMPYEWEDNVPFEYQSIAAIERNVGSGGGASRGPSGPPPPPPPPPTPQVCYGTHNWVIRLDPGGLITTGSYSGRTTAVWKYDVLTGSVIDPSVVWSGSANGIGVTCEGDIKGSSATWTGAWDAKQTINGNVLKTKRLTAIYTLAARLSVFESSVN